VVLFIKLYKVVLSFPFKGDVLNCEHSKEIKATKWSFPMVLFIMLYKVVLNFESEDEILKCDIQMKADKAVLS